MCVGVALAGVGDTPTGTATLGVEVGRPVGEDWPGEVVGLLGEETAATAWVAPGVAPPEPAKG